MPSTTIPVEGDRSYVDAFQFFARRRNSTMARLVRKALDEVYGEDLQPLLDFLLSDTVAQTQQLIELNNTDPTTEPAKR